METSEATEWTPAFDTGLTADDWKQIFEDDGFIKNHPIGSIALWLYYKSDTPLSYMELAEKYGGNAMYYSGGTTQFTTAVASKFKEKINPFKDKTGKDVYWYLPFVRKATQLERGSYAFKLRSEVREGFNKISDECKRKFEDIYLYKKETMNKKTNLELNSKQKEWLDKLQKSRQIILTGAPGTGKSYAAHEIANELTGNKAENIDFVQFHPSMDYTDFVEGLRPIKDNNGQIGFERQDGIFKAFCKKALDNWLNSQKTQEEQTKERNLKQQLDDFLNDAIENASVFTLKRGNTFTVKEWNENSIVADIPQNSKVSSLNISYRVILTLLNADIPLHKVHNIPEFFNRINNSQADSYIFVLCEEIKKRISENKPRTSVLDQKEELENFVFIIDEINRGDISKIFGELFFAIDPSYRGEKGKITTQYQNLVESDDLYADGFYIPENVYIIGTMNDIDRGVESMDFAIRRRFTWIEVTPDDTQSMLDSLSGEIANKAKEKMNALNGVIKKKIGSAYQIGAAYFLKLRPEELNGDFKALWAYHLEPLLREYLRNDPQTEDVLNEMKKAYGVEAE